MTVAVVSVSTAAFGAVALAAAFALTAGGLARLRRALPPDADARASASPPAGDPLARVERIIAAAGGTAAEFHLRLRPLLREIAATRLARRGVRLDTDTDRARALLGDPAWDVLRHDRPPPDPASARGPSAAQIDELIAALERV
jgi:hypothetical protein